MIVFYKDRRRQRFICIGPVHRHGYFIQLFNIDIRLNVKSKKFITDVLKGPKNNYFWFV